MKVDLIFQFIDRELDRFQQAFIANARPGVHTICGIYSAVRLHLAPTRRTGGLATSRISTFYMFACILAVLVVLIAYRTVERQLCFCNQTAWRWANGLPVSHPILQILDVFAEGFLPRCVEMDRNVAEGSMIGCSTRLVAT